MNKLNTGFTKLSDNDFDNKSQAIIAALTGNANFPTTTPTLATVTASISAYQAAKYVNKAPYGVTLEPFVLRRPKVSCIVMVF